MRKLSCIALAGVVLSLPVNAMPRMCSQYVRALAAGGVGSQGQGASIALLGAMGGFFRDWLPVFREQGWEVRPDGLRRASERVLPLFVHPFRLPGLVVDAEVDASEGLQRARAVALQFSLVSAMQYESLDGVCRLTYEPVGDLTPEETAQIQAVVDREGVVVAVGGSAARGERRNAGTAMPYGKGDSSKSDIDFWFEDPKTFGRVSGQLPGFDGKPLLSFPYPGIYFSPGRPPLALKFVAFGN
jgi:hypothetical protein